MHDTGRLEPSSWLHACLLPTQGLLRNPDAIAPLPVALLLHFWPGIAVCSARKVKSCLEYYGSYQICSMFM